MGFIFLKEGKTHGLKNIEIVVKMPVPKTPQEIQVFHGTAQFYQCFIKDFAYFMAPITKLLKKIEAFDWTTECQNVWEEIKN